LNSIVDIRTRRVNSNPVLRFALAAFLLHFAIPCVTSFITCYYCLEAATAQHIHTKKSLDDDGAAALSFGACLLAEKIISFPEWLNEIDYQHLLFHQSLPKQLRFVRLDELRQFHQAVESSDWHRTTPSRPAGGFDFAAALSTRS
jgi:hypothetical protein